MLGKNQMVVVESLVNKVTVLADMGRLPAKIYIFRVWRLYHQPMEKLNHCVFCSCTYIRAHRIICSRFIRKNDVR